MREKRSRGFLADFAGISIDQVKATIDDWINYYNNDRYQWQLAELSPNEFYYYYSTSGLYPLPGSRPPNSFPNPL